MAEHDHGGHRQRIIKKIDSGSLCEHELLEILLFNAIPRRNTNDLSHRLLAAFGNLRAVLSASVEQLQKVDGIGLSTAAYLSCIGKVLDQFYAFGENGIPRKYEKNSFLRFVETEYEKEKAEVLDFYLLNEDQTIVFYKRFRSDSANSVKIDPKEFTKLLMTPNVKGVVIVHNHPYGEPEPSEKDDELTKHCVINCAMNNVVCCDHIIYSPKGLFSYYFSGKMSLMHREFSIEKLTKNSSNRGSAHE